MDITARVKKPLENISKKLINDHVFGAVETTARAKTPLGETVTVMKQEPEVQTAGHNVKCEAIVIEPFENGKQSLIGPFSPVSGKANKMEIVRLIHTNREARLKYELARGEVNPKPINVPWDPGI